MEAPETNAYSVCMVAGGAGTSVTHVLRGAHIYRACGIEITHKYVGRAWPHAHRKCGGVNRRRAMYLFLWKRGSCEASTLHLAVKIMLQSSV